MGSLGYSDQEKAHDAIDAMWKNLKSMVREIAAASLRHLAELPQQSDVRNRQGRLELSHRSVNLNMDKTNLCRSLRIVGSGGHGSAGG